MLIIQGQIFHNAATKADIRNLYVDLPKSKYIFENFSLVFTNKKNKTDLFTIKKTNITSSRTRSDLFLNDLWKFRFFPLSDTLNIKDKSI